MQKNRLASLVVFYVLLSATFSFIPVLAQSPSSSDIIQSILDESKSQVEQKITQLEENGIIIPSSASAFYNDGLAEYDAALTSLGLENLEEARDHALEAMSLFEDATEALYVAEQDFQSEQQATLNEIFELGESISNSESDADELRDLASINNLDVSFTDYDNAIAEALRLLAEGNLDEARQQYEIAQNLLADIYDQIHDEAYSNVDQRAQDFVANTITQLNEIIANASEFGISQSIIDQLQDIIDDLQSAESTDDIIYVSDASSDLYDLTTENPEWIEDEETEIEVEVGVVSAEVEVDFDGQEFKFVVQDTDETDIATAIRDNPALVGAGFSLSISDIMAIWEFEVEEEETEIEVEVGVVSAEVEVDFDGQEFKFVVQDTDETDIATAIRDNPALVGAGFSLSISDIMAIWEFEVEEEEYEGEVETQSGTQSVTEEEEEEIKLYGTVTGISDGTITLETDVGPVTILTDGNTEFKGFDDLSEIDGLEVKVRAVETNDGLLATVIDLEEYEEEVETQSGTQSVTEEEEEEDGDASGSDGDSSGSDGDGDENSG